MPRRQSPRIRGRRVRDVQAEGRVSLRAEHLSVCKCCGLVHDVQFCSQCVWSGCKEKKKSEPCQVRTRAVGNLSVAQLRQRLVEAQKEIAHLTTEAQRLVRLIMQTDPKILENREAIRAVAAAEAPRA